MKFIATIAISLLALQLVQAKNLSKALPEKITSYMQSNYPKATKVDWAKGHSSDSATVYQAHFYNDSLLVTLEITSEGLVIAKETEISVKDVPSSLLYFIQGHKVKFVAVIEYNNEKPVYLLETKYKKHADFEVFNANGSVLHVNKHFLLY